MIFITQLIIATGSSVQSACYANEYHAISTRPDTSCPLCILNRRCSGTEHGDHSHMELMQVGSRTNKERID